MLRTLKPDGLLITRGYTLRQLSDGPGDTKHVHIDLLEGDIVLMLGCKARL